MDISPENSQKKRAKIHPTSSKFNFGTDFPLHDTNPYINYFCLILYGSNLIGIGIGPILLKNQVCQVKYEPKFYNLRYP